MRNLAAPATGRTAVSRALRLLLTCIAILAWYVPVAPLASAAPAPARQVTLLPPLGATSNEQFGASLALDGTTLVVGAPDASRGVQFTGAVYVLVRTADGWARQATLTAPDGIVSARFGRAIAISGDTIAVGEPQHNGSDGTSYVGVVYVFVRSGATWSLQATLTAPDVPLFGYFGMFGRALVLDGDTLAIGGDQNTDGAVYVFKRNGGNWSQSAKLIASDHALYGDFGASLAIDGGTILVGAPGQTAAYVFEAAANGWVQRQKLISGSAETDVQRRFGQSVALKGDTLVVGAPRMNTSWPAAAAYIWTRGAGGWTIQSTLTANDDPMAYSYGMAVALSGGALVVGAPEHHLQGYAVPNLVGNGAAYVYQRNGGSWPFSALLSADRPQSVTTFGAAVLIDGDQLLVGAPRSQWANGSADGLVFESVLGRLNRAADDRPSTPEETPIDIPVLANDSAGAAGSLDPAYIDILLLQRPAHGLATINPLAGTISYTPTKDFNGQDSFGYLAGWGQPATVTVDVTPVAEPPAFTSAPVSAAVERIPSIYQVATADPDPGDQLRISATGLPNWLGLTDNRDGTAILSGTAALADIGAYPISLTVADQAGLSATQAFTIDVQPFLPSPPAQLAATVLSRSQVRLTWADTSTNAQGFVIDRRADGGSWARIANVDRTITSFTDGTLTCNTAYDYRVAAFNLRGSSPASQISGITIDDCTLVAPAALTATPVTTNTIRLVWADRSDNESGFTIERSPDGVNDWSTLGQTPTNAAFYLDGGLSCAARWFYRVRAYNPGGTSAPSNSTTSSVCAPDPPRDFTAQAVSQTSIALAWTDASDNENGFRIESSSDGGIHWSLAAIRSTNATTYTLSGLTCGTAYSYRIWAYNVSGHAGGSSAGATTNACSIIYVDARAAGRNDGSSWANAYRDLQSALTDAAPRQLNTTQIWVAGGTYKPTASTDRRFSFRPANGVALYGGFAGSETALDQRDWRANPTILSGDIGVAGDATDNSYHVVASSRVSAATILDGFTITGGNANGSIDQNQTTGGGMFNESSSPTVRNSIFTSNTAGVGGGMGNAGSDFWNTNGSHPLVDRVMFISNSAGSGGGMYNGYGSNPSLSQVLFNNNQASDGGAMYNYWNSSPTLTNVTFSSNHASGWGGAMVDRANARPQLRNTLFWANSAGWIDQIFVESENSVPTISDSLLQEELDGGYGGGISIRNRIGDAMFVDADGPDNLAGTLDDDLRLQSGSPAVDAGNNTSLAPGTPTDLGGSPRFADHRNKLDSGIGVAPIVDIGVYEYQPPPAPRAAPSNLTATPTSRVGIALAWADHSDDELGFKIERLAAGGAWSELVRLPAGATSYTDSPLPCGTAYSYRVRAYNPGGDSEPSNAADAATLPCVAQIIYVDRDAVGTRDGSSWANAYTSLQDALGITTLPGDEIWLAEGVYMPAADTNRAATFRLISGVAIYGGFGGGETERAQRDWLAHPTTLSGDLLGNDPPGTPSIYTFENDMADNSYHLVTSADADASTILDGLTISGGNAYHAPGNMGGGMLTTQSYLRISHVVFRRNAAAFGAGIANLAGGAPAFSNVTFTENLCYAGYGGGMYNQDSRPILDDVTFVDNHTYSAYGAGMYNKNSPATLRHVRFSNNDSYWGAGGMNNENSDAILLDVLFDGNRGDVGGMANQNSAPQLRRVIFRDNIARNTNGGGGMFNDSSSPTLLDVSFTGNISHMGGGGMYNHRSAPTLINVTFSGNEAPFDNSLAGGGGGMFNIISSPTLINVVFSGNRATSPFNNHGGAIANYMQSNPTLINVTFSGNSALVGGAIYSTSESRPSIRNSILWGDTANSAAEVFDEPSATTIISDSIVAGGYAGTLNRDAAPRFADADGADNTLGTDDDNLRLLAGSPAIDAGANLAVPLDSADLDGDDNLAEPLPFDRDHAMRFADDPGVADTGEGTAPIVDLGAYEYPIPPPLALAINYATGQPGSSFLVTGNGFQPDARLRVAVNGMELGLVTTDQHGDITLILRTLPQAAPGEYRVSVAPIPAAARTARLADQLAELRYTLDRAAPLREQAPHSGATELVVPRAVEPAGQRSIYLPIVTR